MNAVRTGIAGLLAGLLFAASAGASATQTQPSCPSRDATRLVSIRAGARHALVPETPRTLLLCRYAGTYLGIGTRRAPFTLLAHAYLRNSGRVGAFAAEFDALRPDVGVFSCPASSGAAIIAYFGYRSGPDDPVTIAVDGCLAVSNGLINRGTEIPPGSALVARIERLVPLG